jgi:hypothetical protein
MSAPKPFALFSQPTKEVMVMKAEILCLSTEILSLSASGGEMICRGPRGVLMENGVVVRSEEATLLAG